MPGPVYDDCPACGGTGQGQDWSTGNLIECPYCKGLGREVKVISRQEEKERRRQERLRTIKYDNDTPFGSAPKWFGAFFGASLVLSVALTLAFIALIVAIIIALV